MNDSGRSNIAAVILAAGEGKRFGGPKALARLGGMTFLEIIVGNLQGIVNDIVVVGGSKYDEIEKEANRLGVSSVFNPDWPMGQFTSLKAGLRAITDDIDAFFVILVDHPLVNPETYIELMNRNLETPQKILIPVYNGRRGHPLIIPARLRNEIVSAPGQSNLRDILKVHSDETIEVLVNDIGILRDIDSRHDLEEACRG
jgi:molybdenum cofactor cytidylyltransferase